MSKLVIVESPSKAKTIKNISERDIMSLPPRVMCATCRKNDSALI